VSDELLEQIRALAPWHMDIALTPNYDSVHRSHFHTDLTPGGNTIKLRDAVDLAPEGWVGDD